MSEALRSKVVVRLALSVALELPRSLLSISELLILIEATVEPSVEARIEATELSGSVSEVVPVGSVVEE